MNSIRMPAVTLNQMAANTGAVVRNFFMVKVMEASRKGCGKKTFSWVKILSGAKPFSGVKR